LRHIDRWSWCLLRLPPGLNLLGTRALSTFLLSGSPRLSGAVLTFENPRPIEFNVRVVLLDQPDGVFVERGAPDAHAWRRSEPIEDA
jgi:hypothetical protein